MMGPPHNRIVGRRVVPPGTLTAKQYAMLVAANGCSLPGDGLRIVGPGEHTTADSLRRRGWVRVETYVDARARVFITPEGRLMCGQLVLEKS